MYTRCSTTCKTLLLLLLLLLLSLYYPITIIRIFSTCPPVSTYSEYACPPYGRYLRITRPRAPSSISGYVPTTYIPRLFKLPRIIRPRRKYTTPPQKGRGIKNSKIEKTSDESKKFPRITFIETCSSVLRVSDNSFL